MRIRTKAMNRRLLSFAIALPLVLMGVNARADAGDWWVGFNFGLYPLGPTFRYFVTDRLSVEARVAGVNGVGWMEFSGSYRLEDDTYADSIRLGYAFYVDARSPLLPAPADSSNAESAMQSGPDLLVLGVDHDFEWGHRPWGVGAALLWPTKKREGASLPFLVLPNVGIRRFWRD